MEDQSLKQSAKIDHKEWIADCYSKEEKETASNWIESTAKAILGSKRNCLKSREKETLSKISKRRQSAQRRTTTFPK